MKQSVLALLIIVVSMLGLVVLNSAYTVEQTEQAVITQFGEPLGGPIKKPGLHWKTPFVQLVHKFDHRILEWDGYPSEIPTRDKKFIWVDPTGRWKIVDPMKFFQTVHNERNAQSRLDDIMDGITRNFITRYNLPEIVRSTDHVVEAKSDEEDFSDDTVYENIEEGRDHITRKILEEAGKIVQDYGIELVDIRIKRIKYVDSVQRKVFDRMISERKRAAEELRSEGHGVRAEIQGSKDKELKRIYSEAYRQVQKIKGEADAEATRIYGEAYSKDPDFYGFMQTLEKYPDALKESRLVLTTGSDFLKYLKRAK